MEAARARVPTEADHALAASLVHLVLTTRERLPVTAIRAGWRHPLAVAAAAVLLVAGTAFATSALVIRVRAERATGASAPSRQTTSSEPQAPRRAAEVVPDLPPADTGQAADPG